jgi:hypothetical protein
MSATERRDGIELLRPYELGIPIGAVEIDHPGMTLNTAEDATAIEEYLHALH